MSVTAHIALGSNIGDRRAALDGALRGLAARPGVRVGRVSRYIETDPVGGPAGQPAYLNAAAELQTELAARDLLSVMLAVEADFGRTREIHWGPRTLDLDLLLYGHGTSDDPVLTLPHPRMHERLFVLEPLAEIAPDVVHPRLKRTVAELLAEARRR